MANSHYQTIGLCTFGKNIISDQIHRGLSNYYNTNAVGNRNADDFSIFQIPICMYLYICIFCGRSQGVHDDLKRHHCRTSISQNTENACFGWIVIV